MGGWVAVSNLGFCINCKTEMVQVFSFLFQLPLLLDAINRIFSFFFFRLGNDALCRIRNSVLAFFRKWSEF